MSARSMWKMLHRLHTIPPGKSGLTAKELARVGIDCGDDTIIPFVNDGVVAFDGKYYSLTPSARRLAETCVVANKRWSSDDLWVDHPSAFVVMPFREKWSDRVYRRMIQPAVEAAGLDCIRGDVIVRVGDLTQNVWGALLRVGLIIADVSALNANVFYELGLAHALGKDTIVLKQHDASIPADIGGVHYHEYQLTALKAGERWLTAEISEWARNNHVVFPKARKR